MIRRRGWAFISASGLAMAAFGAHAGDKVLVQPIPEWVRYAGKLGPSAPADGVPLLDIQQKADLNGVTTYEDVAVRATSTQELAAIGTISNEWYPDKGDLIIHRLEIVRGDQVIDVSDQIKNFTVLHREKDLEAQTIDGKLTASLQVEGLKVGDILRYAASVRFKDPVLGPNVETTIPLAAHPMQISKAGYRLLWPKGAALKWRVSPKDVTPVVSQHGNDNELTIALPLAKQPDPPQWPPLRFVEPPMFEASTFSRWEDVSIAEAKVFPETGLIAPNSSLAARVAAIAARSKDPLTRAADAVRLVQDDIRYFANGQNEGNLVPQMPMDTWEKRYGDCKAKSLLLAAILRELGIEAVPALTHASEGDLIPVHLPGFGAFNHMITRAVIGGKVYWLDGTLSGTRLADLGDTPPYHFALPVRPRGATLEAIVYAPPARPALTLSADVDDRAGVALPAPFKLDIVLRGSSVPQLKSVMGQVDPKKFNEITDKLIKSASPSVDAISRRNVAFHDEDGTLEITAEGLLQLDWKKVGDRTSYQAMSFADGIDLTVDRAKPAWRDIPVVLNLQTNFESHLRIRLPNLGSGFRLENPKAIDQQVAGFRIVSHTALESQIFTSDQIAKAGAYELASAALPAAQEALARIKSNPTRVVAPDDLPPPWKQVRAAYASGLTKPIEAILTAAIDQDGEDAKNLLKRALFYTQAGNYPAAIADVTKALALKPDAATYQFRANLYQFSDQSKAIADIKAAQAIEPASASAATLLATIYLLRHDPDDALRAIDDVLPLQEDPGELKHMRAEVLALSGKKAEAIAIGDQVLADSPGKSSALNGRCWLKAIADTDLESALKDCSSGIEQAQDPGGIYDSRGLVYFRLQRYDEAIADLNAAIRLNPESAESLYVRGLARLAKGARPEGEQDIRDAVALIPNIEQVYALYGVVRPR